MRMTIRMVMVGTERMNKRGKKREMKKKEEGRRNGWSQLSPIANTTCTCKTTRMLTVPFFSGTTFQ